MKKGIQYKGRQTTQHESWIVGDLVTMKNGDYKIWTGKGAYSVRQDSIERVDSDWISIDDGLPETLTGCLVFIENQDIIAHGALENDGSWTAVYNSEEIKGTVRNRAVTHWQPLPKSPKQL